MAIHSKKIKFIFVISMLILTMLDLFGQDVRAVDFVISVNEFPHTYAELFDLEDKINIEAYNLTEETVEFYLTPEIWKDGEKFAWVEPEYRGLSVTIPGNNSLMLNGENLDDMFGMGLFPDNILPESFRQFDFTTILPEGVYQICLVAFNAGPDPLNLQISDGYPITCSGAFFVTHDYQPLSIFPDECVPVMDVDANEPVDFDWIIDFGTALDDADFNYDVRLKVIEIDTSLAGDSNGMTNFDQLFSTGAEVVVDKKIPSSQLNVNVQIEPAGVFEVGANYAWRVEVVPNGNLNLDAEIQNYYSEILTFEYGGDCSESDGEIIEEEEEEEETNINNISCEDCRIVEPVLETSFDGPIIPNSFFAGHFEIFVIEGKQGSVTTVGLEKVFSGAEGIVNVKLPGVDISIPIGVLIDDVILNDTRQMRSGKITTKPLEIDQSFLNSSEVSLPEGSDASLESLKNSMPDEYDNFVSAMAVGEQLVTQISSLADNEGLSMPLGIDQAFSGKDYRLTIDEFNFSIDGAFCRATVNFPLPVGVFSDSNITRYISFAVNNLCLIPDGTFGPMNLSMQMPLAVFKDVNGYALYLDGCENCDNESAEFDGSFLRFDCDGVSGGQIDCRLEFPNQEDVEENEFYLTPYVSNTQGNSESIAIPEKVSASFRLSLDNEGDGIEWLAAVDITPFEMSVFPDWGFTVNDAMIDFSENINPVPVTESASIFPEGHNSIDQSMIEVWTGMYLKNIALHLPRSLDSEGNSTIEIRNGVFDFYDAYNFSMVVAAADIGLNVDAGGWGIGINEINVSLLNKSFQDGNLLGGLEAPFLASGDQFAYNASVFLSESEEHLNYAFRINTASDNEGQEVKIPLLLADANLNGASHITLNYEPEAESDAFKFTANIIGDLSISPESIDWLGEASASLEGLPLDLAGIPFLLKYDNEQGFDGSYLGLNTDIESIINTEVSAISQDIDAVVNTFTMSPQEERNKKMLGINLEFKRAELGGSLQNPELLLEPRLMVMDDGSTSSTQSGFGIDARVIINAKLNSGKIEYDNFQFECLGLDYQSSAVMVRGSVCYRRDLAEQTKVLSGEIVVDVAGLGGGIAASASYGTKYSDSNLTQKDFSFWYAKLAVKIDAGIPMGQIPMSIYGLGGGIFYNYKLAEGSSFMADFGRGSFSPAEDRTDLYGSSGLIMQQGFYGLGLWGLFGPSGDPKAFNFDLALEMQFSSNSFSIGVEGNVYTLTPDMWRTQEALRTISPVFGSINGQFSINDISTGESEFLIAADVGVAFPPSGYPNASPVIYTASHNGGPGLGLAEAFVNNETFYAYVGVPRGHVHNRRFDNETMGPVSLKAKLGNALEFNSEFYMMFGDGIPTSISLPDEISELIQPSSGSSNSSFESFTSSNNERPPLPPGSGFAIGGKIQTDIDLVAEIGGALKTGVEGFGMVGFDINLTKSELRQCHGKVPGIDGWYAMGQMYAGLDLQAYILGTKFINLQAVAVLQGGLPEPIWFQTLIQLNYDMRMDLYNGGKMAIVLQAIESSNLLDMEHESDWGWTSVRHSGNFRFFYEYLEDGYACLPYVDYAATDDIPVKMIQSIIPADLTHGHDIYNTKVQLNLLNPHKVPVEIQIVENESFQNISLTPRLDYLKIKKNGNLVIQKGHNDIAYGDKNLIIDDAVFSANTTYDVEVKFDLLRNGTVYDSETKVQSFETGNLSSELDEAYIVATFPEKWHNYFRVDDYEFGFIQFESMFYDAMFGENGTNELDLTEVFIQGNLVFQNDSNISTVNPSVNTVSENLTFQTSGNSIVNPAVQNIVSPVTNSPNSDVSPVGMITSPFEGIGDLVETNFDEEFRFLIKNRDSYTDEIVRSVIFDAPKKQLKFSLEGLQPSKKYDLYLQIKNGTEYYDIYTVRFNTSRFGSMAEKLAAITPISSTTKSLELEEAFDSYDKEHLDLLYNLDASKYVNLNSSIKHLLTSNNSVNIENATILTNGGTIPLNGEFSAALKTQLNLDIESTNSKYSQANELALLHFGFLNDLSGNGFNSYPISNLNFSSDYRFVINSEIGFEQEFVQTATQNKPKIESFKLEGYSSLIRIPEFIISDMDQKFRSAQMAISNFFVNNIIEADSNKWVNEFYDSSLGGYVTIPNQWGSFILQSPKGDKLLSEFSSLKILKTEEARRFVIESLQLKIRYSDDSANQKTIVSPSFIN